MSTQSLVRSTALACLLAIAAAMPVATAWAADEDGDSGFSCSDGEGAEGTKSCPPADPTPGHSTDRKLANQLVADQAMDDLGRFVAQKIYDSYALSLLTDQKFVQSGACESAEETQRNIGETARAETFLSGQKDSGAFERLSSCFDLAGSNASFASTLRNIRCGKQPQLSAKSACARSRADFDDQGKETKSYSDHVTKSVKQLDLIQLQLAEMDRTGYYYVSGGGAQALPTCQKSNYANCKDFFDMMTRCKGETHPSQGCLGESVLDPALVQVWHGYQDKRKELQEARNLILSNNPELQAEIPSIDMTTGKLRTVTAWEEINARLKAGRGGQCPVVKTSDPAVACDRMVLSFANAAQAENRRQKLSMLAGDACKDPKAFGERILIEKPDLVAEFLKSKKQAGLKPALCGKYGQLEAEARARGRRHMYIAAAGAVAIGAALAIPSGGASIALTAAATAAEGVATGTGIYLSANHAYSTFKEASLQMGLVNACLGDYDKMKEAKEKFDEAMVAALIAGGTCGLKALSVVHEVAHLAPQVAGKAPEWLSELKAAQTVAATAEHGSHAATEIHDAVISLETAGEAAVEEQQTIVQAAQDLYAKAANSSLNKARKNLKELAEFRKAAGENSNDATAKFGDDSSDSDGSDGASDYAK